MSDKKGVPPYNINTISSKKIMTIKKTFNEGMSS